jgi:glyoxylase-like metal-dependent hydrolase (beta-lactamase superfamily II)
MTGFPVAAAWFRKRDLGGGLTLIDEPHTDVLMQANIWHLRGRDRDLLVDGGLGVAPLRPAFPELFEGRETIAFATHTHADHIGAIHEFEQRWVHPLEAESLARPRPGTLISDQIPAEARQRFLDAGYPPLGPALVTAVPHAGYDLRGYALQSRPGGSGRGRWSISATGSSGCCMCPAIRPAASPCSRTPPARCSPAT